MGDEMNFDQVYLLTKDDENYPYAYDVIGYGNDKEALEAEADRLEQEKYLDDLAKYERGQSAGCPIPLDQRKTNYRAYTVIGPIKMIGKKLMSL